MPYDTVLLDLDHTLLDSDTSERLAFEATVAGYHAADTELLLSAYQVINHRLWKAVERGELSPDVVRIERFRELAKHHLPDADPHDMAHRFAEGLKTQGSLYPGAVDILEQLAGTATLGLVTNGLSDIQRARVDRLGLGRYFRTVVISAEVGVAKPDPAIFAIAFESLGAPPQRGALMVGDSLSSDMAGAAAFGIDSCWYNPAGNPGPDWPPVTHHVRSLAELPALVGSGST